MLKSSVLASNLGNLYSLYVYNKFFLITGTKFPTTPPPCKKHQIGVQSSTSQPEVFPLTKSKSHESQLANRLENIQLDNDDTSSR